MESQLVLDAQSFGKHLLLLLLSQQLLSLAFKVPVANRLQSTSCLFLGHGVCGSLGRGVDCLLPHLAAAPSLFPKVIILTLTSSCSTTTISIV